jgi:hypothetical protein
MLWTTKLSLMGRGGGGRVIMRVWERLKNRHFFVCFTHA